MASIYQKFGENVKKLRRQKNLTQEELAEMTKCDPRTIIAIEAGERNTTLKTINLIALALKIPASELLK